MGIEEDRWVSAVVVFEKENNYKAKNNNKKKPDGFVLGPATW